MKGNSVISKLDVLVVEARDRSQANLVQSLPEEENLPTSSSSSSHTSKGPQRQVASSRQRKPLSRLPFPNMVGPKCLRLVEVVNSVGASCRRRKHLKEVSSNPSHISGTQSVDEVGQEVGNDNQQPAGAQSGLNFILKEDSLEDVDGFLAYRKDPDVRKLEVELLLQVQSDLGVEFDAKERLPVDRMLELEVRDNENLERNVEEQCFQ
jgi:hypothetical protein